MTFTTMNMEIGLGEKKSTNHNSKEDLNNQSFANVDLNINAQFTSDPAQT